MKKINFSAEPGAGHLRVPDDMDEAHVKWGANCGPISLAALLGSNVMDVRPAFPHFSDRKHWTNGTQMGNALRYYKQSYQARWHSGASQDMELPKFGLVFVTWAKEVSGSRPRGRSDRAVFHWVCAIDGFVFDPIIRFWSSEENWRLYSTGHLLNYFPGIQNPRISGCFDLKTARQILKRRSVFAI